MKVKVVKNKIAIPFKETIVDIIYNEGVNKFKDIIEFGAKKGVIKKSGSWISYDGTNIAQGSDKAAAMLKDNPELTEEILSKLKIK